MQKIRINTTGAPAPIGPYSQAIRVGDTVYISGQIALDPASGQLCTGDIHTETRQVMTNLEAILKAAALEWTHVVKCNIFLSDMALFQAVNEVYGQYFTAIPPARETVAVKTLPKEVNVEISAIAVATTA